MPKIVIYQHLRPIFITTDCFFPRTNTRFGISTKNWVAPFILQLLRATFIFRHKSRTPPQVSARKWKTSKHGFDHSFFYCHMYPMFSECSDPVSQSQHHLLRILYFGWNLRGCTTFSSKNESRSKQLEDGWGDSVFPADSKSGVRLSKDVVYYDEKQSTVVVNHSFRHRRVFSAVINYLNNIFDHSSVSAPIQFRKGYRMRNYSRTINAFTGDHRESSPVMDAFYR